MSEFINVDIVLVEPQGAHNMGSCARVLKNTGFENLVLVNPADFRNDDAYSMACKAKGLLLRARVCRDIDEALEGVKLVAGTTRRKGKFREPLLTMEEALPLIYDVSRRNRVAVLFGREDRGLENPVLSRCDILFEIPSDEAYPSLNLSHAVMVVCHNLFMMSGKKAEHRIVACPKEDVERMYEHLERVLRLLGYGDPDRRGEFLLESVMRNFRKLFGRTSLMKKEVNMIRGILTRIERKFQEEG